jgi:hypothetical protein
VSGGTRSSSGAHSPATPGTAVLSGRRDRRGPSASRISARNSNGNRIGGGFAADHTAIQQEADYDDEMLNLASILYEMELGGDDFLNSMGSMQV